jgi:hypothetical protein
MNQTASPAGNSPPHRQPAPLAPLVTFNSEGERFDRRKSQFSGVLSNIGDSGRERSAVRGCSGCGWGATDYQYVGGYCASRRVA